MDNSYFKKSWIIDLLKKQHPERKDLISFLNKLNIEMWIRQPYVSFMNESLNLKENIILEHPKEGTIVLDVMENGEIYGIEFINQIY